LRSLINSNLSVQYMVIFRPYRRSGIRYNFLYDVLIYVGYMLLFTDL